MRPAIEQSRWLDSQIEALLDDLGRSFAWWIGAEYRRHEDRIVGDAAPAASIKRRIRRFVRDWRKKLDDESARIAEEYITRVDGFTKKNMRSAFKNAGFSISLKNTRKTNTVFEALVNENAALIRNLSNEYLDKAQGVIWRGVSEGNNVKQIRDELVEQVGIEKRRAKRIADDQSNKATQALADVRAAATGIVFGIWQHNSGGSKTYRDGIRSPEDHVALDGEIYVIADGLVDIPGGTEKVKPGQRINCKCSNRVIVPGTALYQEALEKYPEYANT